MRVWPIALVGALAATAALIWFSSSKASEPRALTLTTTTQKFSVNDPDETRLGKLIWRGTIKLTSDDPDFGGLSGLVVSEDGKQFLAITDAAHWVTGTLQYTDGRLTGATGAMIVPMLDANGQIMSGKQGDAEGLDSVRPHDVGGPVLVSFEGRHRLWAYAPFDAGQRRVTAEIDLPAAAKDLPGNGGLETLVATSPDSALAIAEYEDKASGVVPGWVLSTRTPPSSEPDPVAFALKAPYAVTDAKLGPDGMLYLLERNFSRETGVAVRIRRAKLQDGLGGRSIEGEELALMGMSFVIDNFEGIAVRRGADGKMLIYLAADDNFNAPVQQTLLMMFEVTE